MRHGWQTLAEIPFIQQLDLHIEPHLLNTNGVVHHGALFTLAVTVMGVAEQTVLAPHGRCATVDARVGNWIPARKVRRCT